MSAQERPDHVVIINDDAVGQGGAAAIALAAARLLRQREVPVMFLTGGDAIPCGLQQSDVDGAGLGGRHLLTGARGAAAMRGLYDRATATSLAAWISAYDTPGTIYHLHNWHKVLSPSVFTALRGVAPRLVMTAHDYFLACPNGGYFDYSRHAECELQPGGVHCLVTRCDRRHYSHKLWRFARHHLRQHLFDLGNSEATVLAVHEAMVPHLVRSGVRASGVRVLRNFVVPWHTARVAAERNRDVFFVGRVDGDKGPDALARATERAGIRLRIIGDGALAEDIRQKHPHVEILGWCDRARIASLVADARMVVLPTRCRETFGLAALEAAMSGIPVIVSRFSSISDEIVAGGFGLACDPYDEANLAGAIGALQADDRALLAMSQRAFDGARALAPTPDEWGDQLLALYRERLYGSTGEPAPAITTSEEIRPESLAHAG